MSVRISASKLIVGESETFTGHMPVRRTKVYLQEKEGGWRTVAHARGTKRSYVIQYKLRNAGTQSFRTITHGHKAGHSAVVHVTGYQWHYLSSLTPSAANVNAPVQKGVVTIAGAAYPGSIFIDAASASGSLAYSLRGGCVAFGATLGLADQSQTNANEDIAAGIDGTVLYSSSTFTTGKAGVPVQFTGSKIVGHSQLQLGWSNVNGFGGAVPAFGSARILCDW